MLTLIDIILGICTGGVWFIVVILRNLNSASKRNKAQTRYYNRHRRH